MSAVAKEQLTLPPANLSDVEAVIRYLGHPVPPRADIIAISQQWGSGFKDAATKAVNGDQASNDQISAITRSVGHENRSALQALGFDVPSTSALIAIALKFGLSFPRKVYSAGKHENEAHRAASRTEVARMLVSIDGNGDMDFQVPASAANNAPMARPLPAGQGGGAQSFPPGDAPGAGSDRGAPRAAAPRGSVIQMPGRQDAPAERRQSDADREFKSCHVYGGKAALCFNADVRRNGVTRTIRLEAAASLGEKSYDWENKVAIQLTEKELPLVLGVLMGFLTKFEGKGHGPMNEKWFSIEDQRTKFFLSVATKGQAPRGVPIPVGDAYPIIALILDMMRLNDPHLTTDNILSITRSLSGRIAAPAQQ